MKQILTVGSMIANGVQALEIAKLRDRVTSLRAENAALEQQLQKSAELVDETQRDLTRARAELGGVTRERDNARKVGADLEKRLVEQFAKNAEVTAARDRTKSELDLRRRELEASLVREASQADQIREFEQELARARDRDASQQERIGLLENGLTDLRSRVQGEPSEEEKDDGG